ncbi:hypothetical protein FOXYSP1_19030 [Fusarium oxysporum f. sp. phaseoli]
MSAVRAITEEAKGALWNRVGPSRGGPHVMQSDHASIYNLAYPLGRITHALLPNF